MSKIKDVLRLKYDSGLSHEKIARAVNLSKGAVGKYVSLARACEISWPLPDGLDDAALEARLFAVKERPSRYQEPDYGHIHQELKRKGVTLQLLWAEYSAQYPDTAYRYTQFCTRYRQWRGQQRRSLRQTHRAGDKLFIDYAGQTVPVVSVVTGEERQAQVFVAVLGASNYTYAEATWTQSLPDWIGSHCRAFEFFAGVPALLVPDNLRAAIKVACRYEPEPNATYAEMAAHYGTAILPARPAKPRDKAKAELAVQVVERWLLARIRNEFFLSLTELNTRLRLLLVDLNARPFQKLPGCRQSVFEELDRPALRPLPPVRYEFAEWKKAKPGVDYHVDVDHHFYSVPHRLVGKPVDVRMTASIVEVFHQGKRVASHQRSSHKGFSTVDEHMPEAHRKHLQWTPGRFLNWAADIGSHTVTVVKHQLHNRPHPEHGYRACLGLLNHARRYGKEKLEAACQRALAIDSPTYRSVSSILQQGLEDQPLPSQSLSAEDESETPTSPHDNVRGSKYYH